LVEDFERDGSLEAGLLDALTVLGGASGWYDMLIRRFSAILR